MSGHYRIVIPEHLTQGNLDEHYNYNSPNPDIIYKQDELVDASILLD